MITDNEARDLAQNHIDTVMMKPKREWNARANAMVDAYPEPMKTISVKEMSTGFTVTYNTIPPSLAGHRPLYVSADGSEVRKARLIEVWEADPSAFPHMHSDKQTFIDVEEEAIKSGNPWAMR